MLQNMVVKRTDAGGFCFNAAKGTADKPALPADYWNAKAAAPLGSPVTKEKRFTAGCGAGMACPEGLHLLSVLLAISGEPGCLLA